MRFLFYDRILELEAGKHAKASRMVSMADQFLHEHYSRRPVMPATLPLECVAQIAGWLYIVTENFSIRTVLGLVQGVELHGLVGPGDTLELEVWMQYVHRDGATLRGEIRTANGLVLRAERLMFASKHHTDPAHILETRKMFDYLTGSSQLKRTMQNG